MGEKDRSAARRSLLERATGSHLTRRQQCAELAGHLKRQHGGVQCDLTNGFSSQHLDGIRSFFAKYNIDISDSDWIKSNSRATGRIIPIQSDTSSPFQILANPLSEFLCIRAPSHRPRLSNTQPFQTGPDGLVDIESLAKNGPPEYLKRSWSLITAGKLSGIAITSMARLGSIPEAWAAAELIRKYNQQNKISLFVISSKTLFPNNELSYFPVIGARVVNRMRCILSTALDKTANLYYSSIIEDGNLAETLYEYAERLKHISEEITAFDLHDDFDEFFAQEYEYLRALTKKTKCQYGNLSSFESVIAVKDKIVELAAKKIWFPPLV